jgi:hypothetical protein
MRYQVTQVVVVEAVNARQAAHIVQGMQKSDNFSLDHYIVEPLEPQAMYKVDLAKTQGERGYLETVARRV